MITGENLHELKIRLQSEDWNFLYDTNDVDTKYDNFINTLKYYFDTSCPNKLVKLKTDQKQWMNNDILAAKENIFQQYSTWKLTGMNSDKNKYLKLKDIYRNKMHQSKIKCTHDRISNSKNKSKYPWKVINTIRPKETNDCNNTVLNINGKTIEYSIEMCKTLNYYFVNVSKHVNNDHDSFILSGFPRDGKANLRQFHLISPT